MRCLLGVERLFALLDDWQATGDVIGWQSLEASFFAHLVGGGRHDVGGGNSDVSRGHERSLQGADIHLRSCWG